MANRFINHATGMILHPKESTKEIIKEGFGWMPIIHVLLVLSILYTGFTLIQTLMVTNPMSESTLPFTIAVMIFIGIPSNIIFSIFHIGIFYVAGYVLGGRGKFKSFASVMSFALYVNILSHITALIRFLVDISSSTTYLNINPAAMYSTPPAILSLLLVVGVNAYLSYMGHYPMMEVLKLKKKKALVAAYIPFVLWLLCMISLMIFLMLLTS